MMSLLEVVLATVLFCIMVIALTSIWALHARVINGARNQIMANMVGQQVMEQCLSKGFAAQRNVLGLTSTLTATMRGTVVTTDFTYWVTVVDYPFGSPNTLGLIQTIDVTVYYPDDTTSGTLKKLVLEAMVANDT